jgi:hypothetical protein
VAANQEWKALGEVQEILGKLYKAVDELRDSTASDSHKVTDKLDTWISTNRVILESNQQLLTLIVQNSQEVQRSARSYEQGTQLFAQLQQQLENLKTATLELSETLEFYSPAAKEVADSQMESESPNQSKLKEIQQELSRALNNLQGLQTLFSASVEAQIKRLDDWSQKSENILPQKLTVTWKDKVSPLMIGIGAVSAIVLVGLGMAIALTLPQMTQKQAQTQSERSRWANTREGQLAWNIMQWNNHKLSNLACMEDVNRLKVTLKVDGRPAISGFCTIWVVPPEKRTFGEE